MGSIPAGNVDVGYKPYQKRDKPPRVSSLTNKKAYLFFGAKRMFLVAWSGLNSVIKATFLMLIMVIKKGTVEMENGYGNKES